MPQRTHTVKVIGWVWVILSPIMFLMAAVSTVRSIDLYWIQLTVFSVVAIAALVTGVSAAVGAPWARRGLLFLSLLGGAYFFGSGLLMAGYMAVEMFRSGSLPSFWLVAIVAGVLATGLPFWFMARVLRQAADHRHAA